METLPQLDSLLPAVTPYLADLILQPLLRAGQPFPTDIADPFIGKLTIKRHSISSLFCYIHF